MLEIIGGDGTPEREAADNVRAAILELWPDVDRTTPEDDHIRIVANLKVFAGKTKDVDIFVAAKFGRGRSFQPVRTLYDKDGRKYDGIKVGVKSLIFNIEVKDHDPSLLRFDGGSVSVKYTRGAFPGWKDATEQSHQQMEALRSYFAYSKIDNAHITPFVLLRGVHLRTSWPKPPHLNLAGNFSFRELLTTMAETGRLWISKDRGAAQIYSTYGDGAIDQVLACSLFRRVEPTPLDRRRMDLIARKWASGDELLKDLGEKQILFSGRGGAGKTVMLLQMAHEAYQQRNARCLFLTYNRALMADIRRSMTVMGLPSGEDTGGIAVESVMAFIGEVLRAFELLDENASFLDQYLIKVAQLAEMIRSGAVTIEDFRMLQSRFSDSFGFDYVFIDEGQDWPKDEVAILRAMYSPQRLVIADGVDQFVREGVANWRSGLAEDGIRIRRLRKCLRMKSNLASFANRLAEKLELVDWSVDPNPDAGGGRVIIYEGDYLANPTVHRQLVQQAHDLKNYPVDLLCCVPPSFVRTTLQNGRESDAAVAFRKQGMEVWDGAAADVRQDIPRSVNQLRIVQYDSCRGLEGWTVFALGFDTFFEYKLNQRLNAHVNTADLLVSKEEEAKKYAALWLMIALTRPMDTLLIEISRRDSALKSALREIARAIPDSVEWIEGEKHFDSNEG